VGPTDSGKSTIAQILAAYAVRMDRSPVLVDLDVGQSGLTIPGCISAAQLSKGNLSAEVSNNFCVWVLEMITYS
jgi:polynucleotide 5'-kinase involved in rRNA processing